MIQLADVKLVSAVRPTFQDPVAFKRTKFISRVSEQLEIANLLMKGEEIPFSSFQDPVSLRRPRKVSPWWWTDKDGKYLMTIKYGSKVIELAKGKPAVQAETLDQIIEVLKSLKLATSNGELDLHLTQASELIRKKFKVKKAN
ncbi:MAG: hypothetical protein HQ457_10920 [Betaproteobacteria bacterium]|nr:hypothetical protein [Betaproteobacteria bacterium]